jgi:hypothetical protein
MPGNKRTERPPQDDREAKAPTTQAGEFVREEMEDMKEGGGAQSREQAIAIGLSRARRAGVKVPVPKKGRASEATRRKAAQDLRKGKEAGEKKTAAKRAPAKGRTTAARRTKADRSAAARKAAATRRKKQQEAQGA